MQPIDPAQLPEGVARTDFMVPRDFPVTAHAEELGIFLRGTVDGVVVNVVLTWSQIEVARQKAEYGPFRGMTAAQVSTYLSREEDHG